MKEFAAHLIVTLSPKIVATTGGAGLPGLPGKFHATVSEKRVVGNVALLLLSKHHIDGVVQHDVGDAGGWFRHEHLGVGFTSGQIGECADMILMGVGNNDPVDFLVGNQLEIRRRGQPLLLRVHAAVQNDRLPFRSQKVAIRPDLNVPRQIPKLHLLHAIMRRKLTQGMENSSFPHFRAADDHEGGRVPGG